MTDEQIMQSVKEGQLRQLAVLFERYKGPLFGFFWNSTNNRVLSEDLVQSVFERILKYRHSYKRQQPFRPWIFQIARNLKVSHYRQKKEYTSDFDDYEQQSDLEKAVDENIIQGEQYQQLHLAMDELSESSKEILLLSKFQRMPYKEIAQVLSCSESAAKVRVHRAIKQLRQAFFKIEEK